MGTINIGDVRVDMVLAKDVKNINGQLLIPKGLKMMDKHLTLLQAWGITEVEIEGVSREDIASQTAAQIDPKILAEAEAEMTDIFQHANRDHPAVKELFDQCVLRSARIKSRPV
jgi:hypothetical protein